MSIFVFGYVFKVQPAIRSRPRLGMHIWAILWLSFKQFQWSLVFVTQSLTSILS